MTWCSIPMYFPQTRTFSYINYQNQEIDADTLLPAHPQIPFKFHQLSHYILYSKRISSESHMAFTCCDPLVSFRLKQVPWSFLTTMTLTPMKITSQLFCRMSLRLGLSDVSLWLDSDYAPLAGKITEVRCVLFKASCQVMQFWIVPLLVRFPVSLDYASVGQASPLWRYSLPFSN